MKTSNQDRVKAIFKLESLDGSLVILKHELNRAKDKKDKKEIKRIKQEINVAKHQIKWLKRILDKSP